MCVPLTLLLYCSLTNDNTRIEGNWWQNNLVGPGDTVTADSINGSSNLTSFNPDRTYTYSNPFTGDQQTGDMGNRSIDEDNNCLSQSCRYYKQLELYYQQFSYFEQV